MGVASAVRRWRLGFLLSCVMMLAAVVLVAPHLTDSAELVRMRNALLLDVRDTQFDWTPDTVPSDFAQETGPISPAFARRVEALSFNAATPDWERALAIGRHLLENRQGRVGWPIQANLENTYLTIRETGGGYCGDFADVFAGLALAAGLEVRSWAFSFDGFGGRGHVFNEVWDSESGTWRMIDVFHNYYVTHSDGSIVSAQRFRDRMINDPSSLSFELIEPQAKLVFAIEDRAWDFYRRGLEEWYLWWGNAVFTYEDAGLVRALGKVSRSLEQVGAIAQGVHPRIRVVPDAVNEDRVQAMLALQSRLWTALGLGLAGFAGALLSAIGWKRASVRARGVA